MMMFFTFFVLMTMNHQCLSVAMTRFMLSEPPNVDVLDLYYEFLASNSSQVNRTEVVFDVRSLLQCSTVCSGNTNIECIAFAYESRERSCHMFSMLTSGNRISNKTFKKTPDCPADFIYLKDNKKCYRLLQGSYNWSEGRKKCNEINSHLVIVDNYEKYVTLNNFFQGKNYWIWTSGNMITPNQLPFVWKPYQMKDGREPKLPINFYKWRPGQPTLLANQWCLSTSNFGSYSFECSIQCLVICEVGV